MKPNRQPNTLSHFLRILFSAMFVLAFLAAALPGAAKAATTCQAYYTVKEGDTTPYISHTFGFKWKDIATANDMDPWEKLEVGQRLCIPPADQSTKNKSDEDTSTSNKKTHDFPEDEKNAKYTLYISAKRIYLTISKLADNHNYLVKVRDAYSGVGGWSKLGYIEVDKKKEASFSYVVPDDLRTTVTLSVCLKDLASDDLICRTALNP
jgi:transposase